MATVPDEYHDLLTTACFATFATILPDGTPHQTVTWVDYDGEHVLINTAEGRRKVKNVRLNPKVSVNVIDPEDASRYVSISGEVVEVTSEGAAEHANELGHRYYGESNFMSRYDNDVVRLLVRIEPQKVLTH
ncbi:MAG: PPOX class F420-dependent oxidoreductase [Haloferacaceae archaeon]